MDNAVSDLDIIDFALHKDEVSGMLRQGGRVSRIILALQHLSKSMDNTVILHAMVLTVQEGDT